MYVLCLIVYLVQFTYAQQTSANIDKHLGPAELVYSWLVWPTLDQILPTPTAMNHVIVQVLASLHHDYVYQECMMKVAHALLNGGSY